MKTKEVVNKLIIVLIFIFMLGFDSCIKEVRCWSCYIWKGGNFTETSTCEKTVMNNFEKEGWDCYER